MTAKTRTRVRRDASADVRTREVLRARARALAAPPATDQAVAGEVDEFIVRVGDSLYGLPLTAATRATPLGRLTPAPGAPAEIAGLAIVAGEIVNVVDLGLLLGLTPSGAVGTGERLVSLKRPPRTALRVDAVLGSARTRPQPDADGEGRRLARVVDGTPGSDNPVLARLDPEDLQRRILRLISPTGV